MSPRAASIAMRRTALVFTVAGWLLVALGAIHLAVIPLVTPWVAAELAPGSPRLPAFVLDHVVAGVLLFPLGALTVYAARALATGERWARVVCTTTACTVLTFPIATAATMAPTRMWAWPFATAVTVMAIAATLMLIGVLRVARASRRPGA